MAKRIPKLVSILLLVVVLAMVIAFVGSRKEGFEENTERVENLYISMSDVHGVGVFVGRGFAADEMVLAVVEPEHKISALGSKVNHCMERANVVLKEAKPGYWNLYAIRDLEPYEEILSDYNNTPDFIAKPDPSWTC